MRDTLKSFILFYFFFRKMRENEGVFDKKIENETFLFGKIY